MKDNRKHNSHGTREWSEKTFNCCKGCSHDCLYCYAKEGAIRRKQIEPEDWPNERIQENKVSIGHRKKYEGQLMFPSTHDITPNNFDACITKLKNLLTPGNRVLVVSKPHLECIEKLCESLRNFKSQILFRFSIGACDDQILSYWEPNAPGYDERKESLIVAHQEGFQTSVSVEPMLDSVHIATLIGELLPYVSQSLWIGKMNHLGRFGKGSDMVLQQAIKEIKRGQADSIIKSIYRWYKDDPLIKWKKEIKRVVGIPIPKQNGLDI
jgi:DNA repair photolyase